MHAVTYMNKVLKISYDEFIDITRKLYKSNIEIRKLIKCFFVYSNHEFENIAFLILPEYFEEDNEVYSKIKSRIIKEYVIIDSNDVWQKVLHRRNFKANNASLIIEDDGAKNIVRVKMGSYDYDFVKIENIKEELNKQNSAIINFNIESQMMDVFLDAEVFYKKELESVMNNLEMLSKDSLMLEDERIKSQVKGYKEKLFEKKADIEKGQHIFNTTKEECLGLAKDYELSLSDMLVHDIDKNVNSDAYRNTVLSVFFKSVLSENLKELEKSIFKLRRLQYEYIAILDCVLHTIKDHDLTPTDIHVIMDYPSDRWEIAKAKMILSKQLGYKYADMKEIVQFIDIKHFDNGKEYYFLGKKCLDDKDYLKAKECFEIALDDGYIKAGHELIKLADRAECEIDIEELAENLIPEANYHVGCNSLYIENKKRKGIVHIKIAASKEYFEAVREIAEFLYGECKTITWQNMEKQENINKVNNVIRLYEYLEKKNTSAEEVEHEKTFLLRIGLMYCKLKDYGRAYIYLKDIKEAEAQYECAKMCQYGNGVARDPKTAIKHYKRIKVDYKDTKEQLKKLESQMESDKPSQQKAYSETKSYKSTTQTISSSSSYCFITTAACIALDENKDCVELNQLRWFRDEHILDQGKEGRELVDEYYRIGPTIVDKIDSDWNPQAIYKELWEDYILPSCYSIKRENWDEAREIYIRMVKKLCEIYNINVRESIKKRYDIHVS